MSAKWRHFLTVHHLLQRRDDVTEAAGSHDAVDLPATPPECLPDTAGRDSLLPEFCSFTGVWPSARQNGTDGLALGAVDEMTTSTSLPEQSSCTVCPAPRHRAIICSVFTWFLSQPRDI